MRGTLVISTMYEIIFKNCNNNDNENTKAEIWNKYGKTLWSDKTVVGDKSAFYIIYHTFPFA